MVGLDLVNSQDRSKSWKVNNNNGESQPGAILVKQQSGESQPAAILVNNNIRAQFQLGSPSQVINEECPNKIVNLLDEPMDQVVDVMPTEDDEMC